ncbi:phosphatidate cytidylyltransferase [Thermospira aquatica]|uniref:Phosphatidate cytidylyltransferase n=1 Tax=Thermospira aquatica TaxID=2828656 RepID=A0AAX3BCG5_9SPIR|nr:phosphatidate cytidylyltransferase [Thermospira aquatica]URA09966.1 phosphatidate cytidylyltransferase [Thermospira aquatica]
MRERFIVALVLIPIGAFFVFTSFWNNFLFFLAFLVVSLFINYEVASLLEKRGFHFYLWTNSILVTLSTLSYYLFSLQIYDLGYFYVIQILLLSLSFLITFFLESLQGKFEDAPTNLGMSLAMYILTGIFFPFLILLKAQDRTGWLVFLPLFLTWIGDAGGYFAGKLFGNHKLSFLSSPNKTIEGYAGVLFVTLAATIGCFGLQRWFHTSTNLSLLQFLLLGIMISIAGSIGDLAESTIKRWSKAKDSGSLLPGHGGFFDRFDSVLFSTPVFYIILKLMGY